MRKHILQSLVILIILSLVISCANRGTPSGGDKDVDAPVIIKSLPENMTTNFKGKEIKIYFDEYVKINNLQKQLIVSPPMDPEPTVTPLGTASKYVTIIINDTLADNTTYAFNFGQSIVDNNEENPYDYYRYVFSTGDYIDSLSVKGQILDAENRIPEEFVSVMLYEKDSTYTDSIVYKSKPKYITNTLDSLTTFSIDNIKPGTYKLVALKDDNGNFTFQQDKDKIGFYEGFITAPTDSLFTIKLFKETLNFDAKKPRQAAGQKIGFGYEGDYKTMAIELLDNKPEGFTTVITKDPKADTLYYWYKPKLALDSTQFIVRNKTFIDTLKHRFRSIDKDSLTINMLSPSTLGFNDDVQITGSIPFTKFNEKQIQILDRDSVIVPFKTTFNTIDNLYSLQFEKQEKQQYNMTMLPGAIEDFFGNVNDTLKFAAKTKLYSDYSNIRITLRNMTYPAIVQLITDKDEVKYEQFATEDRLFDFRNLTPGNYFLRVVFDTNGNQKWDSGNYLEQRQAERISYKTEIIEARANWDPVETFTLLD
ncbi:Ig-like domain-containing protein [Psychroserpens damuponensis]|uniref:Ig-like domain-containing protein n=1 Tax=Psychroserpens damuponensis TaxID=943936 RepID=UPI00058FF5D9|nr:Ig-like domain-containing protein [Psychroserpens damuponensis]